MAADKLPVETDPPELGPLRDNSLMWRISLWGAAAVVASAAAVLVVQTDFGSDRLMEALGQKPTQVAVDDALTQRVEAQRVAEARALEARVRELTADRDRLSTRLAALEHNFGDLTGSIKRDLAVMAAIAPPKPATPAPVLSAPATTAVDTAPEVKPEAKAAEPKQPEAKTQMAAAAAAPAVSAPVAAAPAMTAVPTPPQRVATLPDPTATEEPRKPAAGTGGLGIDLGGARSIEVLNARWVAVKANFGPLIEGLHPLMQRDERPGVIPFRLIVGPIPNGAAAATICARFAASKVSCRSTKFSGEQISSQ